MRRVLYVFSLIVFAICALTLAAQIIAAGQSNSTIDATRFFNVASSAIAGMIGAGILCMLTEISGQLSRGKPEEAAAPSRAAAASVSALR